MAKPHFPDNFTTELPEGGTAIEIRDADGWLLNATSLRHLSDKLLLGKAVDRIERAVAGAAISHLLALHASSSAVPDGVKKASAVEPFIDSVRPQRIVEADLWRLLDRLADAQRESDKLGGGSGSMSRLGTARLAVLEFVKRSAGVAVFSMRDAIEELAQGFDGCMVEAVGGEIGVGEAIRTWAARQDGMAALGVPAIDYSKPAWPSQDTPENIAKANATPYKSPQQKRASGVREDGNG